MFYEDHERKKDSISILVLPEYALGNKIRLVGSNVNYEAILDDCRNLTKDFNFNFFAGSAAIFDEDHWHNRNFLIDSNGNVYHYDKMKLFNYEKKLSLQPGSNTKIFTLPGGITCLPLICSDFWYPELIREHITALPDLVVVPTMSVVPKSELVEYGRWLWHSLSTTRSRENVVPVIVADWAMQQFGDSWTCGASCILNPAIKWTTKKEYGEAFISKPKEESGFITTSVSITEIYEYRKYRQDTGLLP